MELLNNWQNLGDVSLDQGAIFIKADKDFEGCFYIVKNNADEDSEANLLYTLYVDINDSWIDWDEVQKSCDTDMKNEKQMAVDLAGYYSYDNFGTMELFGTFEQLEEEIKEREIIK